MGGIIFTPKTWKDTWDFFVWGILGQPSWEHREQGMSSDQLGFQPCPELALAPSAGQMGERQGAWLLRSFAGLFARPGTEKAFVIIC